MNKFISLVAIVLISVASGYTGAKLALGGAVSAVHQENAYERVLSSGVLRCGYYVFPPAMSIDAKTGEKTGFSVDLINKVADRLHIKVEWTEEVNFGTMMEALKNNRFDAICTPVWINAAQGRAAEYTRDLFFSSTVALVRADDNRFDESFDAANAEDITLATIDGEITSAIAADDFPKAKTVSLPNNSSLSQIFVNVADKKADMTFADRNSFEQYAQQNNNVLKIAAGGKPVRIFPFALAVAKGEFELQSLLDYTLTEMLYSGEVERIVKKNELFPDCYLQVDLPYRR